MAEDETRTKCGKGVAQAENTVGNPAQEKRKLLELLKALEAIGSPPGVQERDPFEFPERRGL
jgi:hypothetical protein